MASLEPTFDNHLGKKALESDQRLENDRQLGFHTSKSIIPFTTAVDSLSWYLMMMCINNNLLILSIIATADEVGDKDKD